MTNVKFLFDRIPGLDHPELIKRLPQDERVNSAEMTYQDKSGIEWNLIAYSVGELLPETGEIIRQFQALLDTKILPCDVNK